MDFSIVTASFRQLELLKSCIASVADQEGVTMEHVIQDGGTPGFPKFAQEMAQRCPERPGYLRPMLSEPDCGMYDGINRALKRSQGQICGYLNSDEQYLPGALASVLNKFREEPKLGAVLGDVVVIRPDGTPLCFRKMVVPQLAHTWTCHFSALTAGIFFRRELFEQGLLYDTSYRIAADAEWFVRLIAMGTQVGLLSKTTSTFMESGQNLGLGEKARAEARRLCAEAPWWMRSLRPLWVFQHRWKRLTQGAHIRRTFEYQIYGPGSTRRHGFYAHRLSPIWPGRVWNY
jgi:glycosyltransferase involved in cell wall biosynthesis